MVDTVPVDLEAPDGVKIRGVTQDIGPGGLFVRSKMLLPVGTEVEVQLRLCDPPLRLSAVVVHALAPEEARALGRTPGMGFAFGPLSAGTRSGRPVTPSTTTSRSIASDFRCGMNAPPPIAIVSSAPSADTCSRNRSPSTTPG